MLWWHWNVSEHWERIFCCQEDSWFIFSCECRDLPTHLGNSEWNLTCLHPYEATCILSFKKKLQNLLRTLPTCLKPMLEGKRLHCTLEVFSCLSALFLTWKSTKSSECKVIGKSAFKCVESLECYILEKLVCFKLLFAQICRKICYWIGECIHIA